MMITNLRPTLNTVPSNPLNSFTRGLPYAQCTKSRLMCENYIANYIIFQERQQNSRRFP